MGALDNNGEELQDAACIPFVVVEAEVVPVDTDDRVPAGCREVGEPIP